MAKLLIFRGDALHREVELTEQTVQIGRSPQNEIVLEDPGRGVSRNHAEIRFDNGRYVLVDRQSQNGIWVSGKKVPSVVLGPDVVAAVGPFRLAMQGSQPVATAAGADTSAEFPQLPQDRAEPLVLDDLVAPTQLEAPAPAIPDLPGTTRRQRHLQRPVWLMGLAALLIVALALVGYRFMRRPSPPIWDEQLAEAMVLGGKCQEALDKQINPALTADPNNAKARSLREKCTSSPTSPPPPISTTSVPATSVSDRLDEAEQLVAANDCVKALDAVSAVLAEEPGNQRANEISVKAKACVAPKPGHSPAEALAVKVPPEQGGLEPLTKELERDYKLRIQSMRIRYDEAVLLVQGRNYVQGARALDQIASQVPNGYLELAQWRAEARKGVREEARRYFESGQAAENRGDLEAALDTYRRAHDLDSAIDVDEAVQRISARKLQLGTKKCQEGNLAFSYGHNAEALAAYQAAVKLLPQSDPCYAMAQERLKRLSK